MVVELCGFFRACTLLHLQDLTSISIRYHCGSTVWSVPVVLKKPSKEVAEPLALLERLAKTFEPLNFDWGSVKSAGLHNHCLKNHVDIKQLCCGRILLHAREKIHNFREQIGVRLCCFKIGITSNPLIRFGTYFQKGYTSMWLINASNSIDSVSMLEAALISEFGKHVGCHNKPNSGGEGGLNKKSPPPPPYYVYIVGGRADQNRRVG